jgi:hypothetical protein
METLTVKNGIIPKVVNGSFLFIDKLYTTPTFINGRHARLNIGLYFGFNNNWVPINNNNATVAAVTGNDVSSFTYDGVDTLTITLTDGTTFSVVLDTVKVCFNFLQSSYSAAYEYSYLAPYDLTFDTAETSGLTYTLTVGGLPYTLGDTLNKFDQLDIVVNTYGLLILNGTKL